MVRSLYVLLFILFALYITRNFTVLFALLELQMPDKNKLHKKNEPHLRTMLS